MKKVLIVILIAVLAIGSFDFLSGYSILNRYHTYVNFKDDNDYMYHYQKLSDSQKKDYQRMFYAIKQQVSSVYIENNDIDDVENIYMDILYDHPELFYVDSKFEYTLYEKGMDFSPVITYTKDEIKNYENLIYQTVSTITSSVKNMSQIEQLKYVYDYLAQNITYQENENDQNIISAFINHQSVCAGYAKSYQYILNSLGYEVSYIVGNTKESHDQNAKNTAHAWNMICINGDYYYIDPTWGDVEAMNPHTCYGYFLMNSDDMLASYTPTSDYEKTVNNQINYYSMMNCYYDKNDNQIIQNAIAFAKENQTVVEIKCSDENTYNQLLYKIQNTSIIYELLKKQGITTSQAKYSCDEGIHLIEIYY